MKKTLTFILGILLCIGLAVVLVVFLLSLTSSNVYKHTPPAQKHINEKENQEVITQYPNDVLNAVNDEGENNTVTVEMAIEDLREHVDHPYLENGFVAFDKLTFSYPDLDTVRGTFWFIITANENDDSTTYYAKVPYCRTGDKYDGDETNDVFILESSGIVFTDQKMGGW